MQILVTGGAGFIGSNFIKFILKKYPNYKIINLDALTYCGNLKNLSEVENNSNYEFVYGDICDKKLVNALVKKVDWVVNFAAHSHVDNSIKSPEPFIKTNIEGVFNLLEASKEHNIEKFLQISTDEVYGSIEKGSFDENSPLNPSSPYSASKAGADMLVLSYFKTFNLRTLITRCSNNYGPNQYPEKLIPLCILNILKNKNVTLYGNGLNIRNWIYVDDHVNALDKVLHKGKIGEIYNIASDNYKTNLEVIYLILDYMKKDKNFIEFIKDRPGHDMRYSVTCDKIKKLDWQPEITFEKGIKSTVEWYLRNFDNITDCKTC